MAKVIKTVVVMGAPVIMRGIPSAVLFRNDLGGADIENKFARVRGPQGQLGTPDHDLSRADWTIRIHPFDRVCTRDCGYMARLVDTR